MGEAERTRAPSWGWLGLAVFAASAALLGWGIGRGGLYNGDDAIYAQFVREMRETGDLWHLRLDGTVIHQRPPLYPWLLYLSTAIFGEHKFAFVLPAVLAAAGCAALVLRLGLRVGTPLQAVVAALLLPTLGMEFLYARTVTSDTTLTFFVLLSITLFVEARERPRAIYGAGAALGAALMTKQVVGLMPLVAPAALFLAGGRAALPPARRLLGGLGVAAAVAAPWHLVMLALHGGAFLEGYIGYNVLHRASASVLAETSPDFYARVLWRKEGPVVLVAAVGFALVAARAATRRSPGDVLIALWPAGVFGAFTLAASRFDYYVLPAYPALALLIAAPLAPIEARRPALAAALGAALVATSALSHVPKRLEIPDPFRELRVLAETARQVSEPGDPLFVIDELYLVPRYYARRPTFMVVLDRAEYDRWMTIELFREPGTVVYTPPAEVSGRLAAMPRYFAIAPRRLLSQVRPPPGAWLVRGTARYVLYTNVPPR